MVPGAVSPLAYVRGTPYRVDVSTDPDKHGRRVFSISVTIGSDAKNILLGRLAFLLLLVGIGLILIGLIFMDRIGIPAVLGGIIVLTGSGFLVVIARGGTGARRRRLVITADQVDASQADWFPADMPHEMRFGLHMVDAVQPIIPVANVRAVQVSESFEDLDETDFPAGNVLRIEAESGTAVLFIPGTRDEAERLAIMVRTKLSLDSAEV